MGFHLYAVTFTQRNFAMVQRFELAAFDRLLVSLIYGACPVIGNNTDINNFVIGLVFKIENS